MIPNLLLNFIYFCVIVCFSTKPLTFGVLFSTAVNAELVAKPLILGILFSISVIFNKCTCIRNFLIYIPNFLF